MLEGFFTTLLGAFAGVTGSYIVERRAQYRAYKSILDALYVRCDHYVSMLSARAKALESDLLSVEMKDSKSLGELLRANIDPPEHFGGVLVGGYGKYLRPQDIALISQCESNMSVLHRDLMGSYVTPERANSRISVLREESARRCWIIYSAAWKMNESFSSENTRH